MNITKIIFEQDDIDFPLDGPTEYNHEYEQVKIKFKEFLNVIEC